MKPTATKKKQQDKTGAILFIPERNFSIGDESAISPTADTVCNAAVKEVGESAAIRDWQKEAAYRAYDPCAYDFLPLSHDVSFGRLGEPAMGFLNRLAGIA